MAHPRPSRAQLHAVQDQTGTTPRTTRNIMGNDTLQKEGVTETVDRLQFLPYVVLDDFIAGLSPRGRLVLPSVGHKA